MPFLARFNLSLDQEIAPEEPGLLKRYGTQPPATCPLPRSAWEYIWHPHVRLLSGALESVAHSQVLADSAADLLAIPPRIWGMTTAQAKSVGGLAEPAGVVVVQVLLIVADPGDWPSERSRTHGTSSTAL